MQVFMPLHLSSSKASEPSAARQQSNNVSRSLRRRLCCRAAESLSSSGSCSPRPHPPPLKTHILNGYMRILVTSHLPGLRNKPRQQQRHGCDGPRPPCSRRHQFFSFFMQVFLWLQKKKKKKCGSGSKHY